MNPYAALLALSAGIIGSNPALQRHAPLISWRSPPATRDLRHAPRKTRITPAQAKRQAEKRRNQIRHKAACRRRRS